MSGRAAPMRREGEAALITSVAKFKAAFALESDDTQLGAIIQRLVAVMQDVIEQSKGGPLGV